MGPVFGYGSSPPMGTTLPYQRITDRDYFIDDFESVDYNKLIRIGDAEPNEPAHRWRSFEVMHRTDNLYQLGVVIQQNITPIVKGKGSAIFFHVWRGPNSPTLGCTSMSLGDLRSLVTWLDPRMSPVLIQAPTSSIEILRFGTPP
jgi:L,D-peptidoglycan transpeptidase YkuD (ErfK/YbiS/YcfS/YnhG family)